MNPFLKLAVAMSLLLSSKLLQAQTIAGSLTAKTVIAKEKIQLRSSFFDSLVTSGLKTLADNRRIVSKKYVDDKNLEDLKIIDTAAMLFPYRDFISRNDLINTQFQWAVIDSLNSPAAITDSIAGDKYLVGTAATGLWAGQANKIATYNAPGSYTFQTAVFGDLLLNSKLSFVLQWNGTVWRRIDKPKLYAGGNSYGIPISVGTNDAQTFTVKQANVPIMDGFVSSGIRNTSIYGSRIRLGEYLTSSGSRIQIHGPGNFGDLWDAYWTQDYNTLINFGSYTGYADFRIKDVNKIRLLDRSVNIGYQPTTSKGILSIAAPSGTNINSVPPLHFNIPANLLDSARQGSIEVKSSKLYYTGGDTTRREVMLMPVNNGSAISAFTKHDSAYVSERYSGDTTFKRRGNGIVDTIIESRSLAVVTSGNGSASVNPTKDTLTITFGQSTTTYSYDVPGTYVWTKPAGAKAIEVILLGAGGGGGAGRKGLTGTIRCGGGAGSGGALSRMTYDATQVSATVSVVIPSGGIGGVSQATASTNGANGAAGSGTVQFGAFLIANSGNGGSGGTPANGTGATSPNGFTSNGGTGGTASTTGLLGTVGGSANYAPAGGGSGGGITAADVWSAGGSGNRPGSFGNSFTVPSNNGSTQGANATAGATPTVHFGFGGGGGASSAIGNGGNGGNGTRGGGGGGGGSTQDGIGNSGAGGNGGDGYAMIIVYF